MPSMAAFQAGFTASSGRMPSAAGLARGSSAIAEPASARLPSMAPILSTETSTAGAMAWSKPMSLQRMKKSATLSFSAPTAARASAVLSPKGKTSFVPAACQAA